MSTREPIVFEDVMPIEVPVNIAGQAYVLREASGDAACRYRNARSNCTKFVNGEFAGVDGPIADADPRLVSDCLFKVVTMADGKIVYSKVEEKVVRSWPDRIQKALALQIKEVSRIDDVDEETIEKLEERLNRMKALRGEPKNSPSGTADGSN